MLKKDEMHVNTKADGASKILILTAGHPCLEVLRLLREAGVRFVIEPSSINEERLIKRSEDADAILVGSTKISRKIIENARRLKVIGSLGVGHDNIDVDAATENGVLVTFPGHANFRSVAEHTICLMITLARKPLVADRMVRKGMWLREFMNKESLHELYGKTLGIIGFGTIGQRVSRIANILGMKILVVDQVTQNPLLLKELDAEFVSLKELLRRSDIVSLHVPLTPQTRHMISEKEFQIMKDSAMLINTSRGGVIDERSLIRALVEGHISCAGLDVFETEPIRPKNPLLKMDNAILTPHMAWYSEEVKVRIWVNVVNDVLGVFRNEAPQFPVNTPRTGREGKPNTWNSVAPGADAEKPRRYT